MFDIPRLPKMGASSGDNSVGHGVPELVLELNGRTWTLDPSRPYTLGRDPQGDVAIDDARVSWRHATISWGGRSWVIEDHGSTNGTFVQGRRIHQMEIGPGSTLHLGNATDGPRVSLSGSASGAAVPAAQQAQQQAHPQQAPAQQPHVAPQGGDPGWVHKAPPQQQVPAQQGWQQPQQAQNIPPQQGPAVPRGPRRCTATAAPPRSTSWPSAA